MRNLARSIPATLAYLGIVVLLGIVTALMPGGLGAVSPYVSTGYGQVFLAHRWWTLITALLFTHGPGELALVVPLAALGLGFAERRMGTARMVAVSVTTVGIAMAAGLGIQSLGILGGEMWSRNAQHLQILDPFCLVVASVFAASAFTGWIWRSRIRVVGIAICTVLLLYSGQPADLYQLIAALVGLRVGQLLRPARQQHRWLRSPSHEIRVLVALVVAVTAIGPAVTLLGGRRLGLLAPLGLLMSGASPSGQPLGSECDPLDVSSQCLRDLSLIRLDSAGPVILTILPLLALLVAAFGLARGRRLAAFLTIGVNLLLACLGVYYFGFLPFSGARRELSNPNPHYWEITLSLSASVIVPLVIAVIIARNLRHFPIRAPGGRAARYVRVVVVAFVALSGSYLFGGWLVRDQFSRPVTFPELLADLPERFIPEVFVRHEFIVFSPSSPLSGALYNWVGPLFWAIVVIGALSTYFDAGVQNYSQGLPRVRALLRLGGGGYLGQWATWKGNSYWFSADGSASVAYRVLAGVAITTSEPIGRRMAARAAIGEFARYCDDNGWIPVFYAIHEPFIPTVRDMGWRTLVVGEETVIRPAEWNLEGKRKQDIRSSINRADRLGIRAVWTTYAKLSDDWKHQLEALSDQWTAGKRLPEMGFTLGSIEELRSSDVGILLAADSADQLMGVTSWMPSYRRGEVVGWTLDFMRRTPAGMNGVMEFIIASAAQRFKDQGVEFMSLSTAPLATTLSSSGQTAIVSDKLLGWVGRSIEPMYGFRSLFDFKRKFQPEFHPVYLAYPDALGLPAIALALVKAYLPVLSVGGLMRLTRVEARDVGRRLLSMRARGARRVDASLADEVVAPKQ